MTTIKCKACGCESDSNIICHVCGTRITKKTRKSSKGTRSLKKQIHELKAEVQFWNETAIWWFQHRYLSTMTKGKPRQQVAKCHRYRNQYRKQLTEKLLQLVGM